MKKPETILAWAWEFKDGDRWFLCAWAEPTEYSLRFRSRPKPSPEARPVCVRMTRNKERVR